MNEIYKIIKEKKWDEVDSKIVEILNENHNSVRVTKNKLIITECEIGEIVAGELKLFFPLKKETELFLLGAIENQNNFPKIILGKYTTLFKKLEIKEDLLDVADLEIESIDESVSKLDKLGVAFVIDIVLTRSRINRYKISPLISIESKSNFDLISSYLANRFIFYFDCETTGLSAEKEQMLEFFGKMTKNGQTLEQIHITLSLDPGRKVNPEALKVNKIDPFSEEWNSRSVDQSVAAKRISDFLLKYSTSGEVVFCAYNARFDYGFLSSLFSKNPGVVMPEFSGVFDPLCLSRILTDEDKLSTKIKDNGKRCNKLDSVASALNIEQSGQLHRASTDVILLEKVVNGLIKLI